MNQIKEKVKILVISETKLDKSFPEDQFKIPGFTSHFQPERREKKW